MSAERFRKSAERINRHHGGQSVTLSRGSISLIETVSGAVPALTCGVAAEDATSLPLASAVALDGNLPPGATLAVAGHSTAYTVQAFAEPSGSAITASVDPGLEAAVNGEAVTLSAKTFSLYGGKIELRGEDIPAGWTVGAKDEIWSLVPPSTAVGSEPRDGDLMTAPYAARVGDVGGREGVEYIVRMMPQASEEAS